MKRDIKAPSVGESITEVRVGTWKKADGESVKSGDVLLEIESDKATVEVVAEFGGALKILHATGDTVAIGELLAQIDEGAAGTVAGPTAPAGASVSSQPMNAAAKAPTSPVPAATGVAPSVRRVAAEAGVDVGAIAGTGRGGRVTKGDALSYVESGGRGAAASQSQPAPQTSPASPTVAVDPTKRERRVLMPLIRQKIAERLVEAQHTAAILSTFNECDMTEVNAVRTKHKEAFKAKHGVSLSYMSFFTRAVVEALKAVPGVNAMIDGKEFVYRDYYDVGIAVGTERGLVVPVLRDAGRMGFVDIEKGINAMALKAREGKLAIKDLSGGTFTISNGGTYGSLLSTPILNPPQSGILGMHKIMDRPMAINGQVLVRPMMYLALSYDHRIIDGKEAVTFLIKVKEGIENPSLLGLDF